MSLKNTAASTPMTAHRLQGDLAGELGVQARVEHRGADAEGSVLGKAATGLAHEPDRGALGTLTAQGCDQRRGGGPTVTERVRRGGRHILHPPTARGASGPPRQRADVAGNAL